jgi:predicted GNAT superfamily acetyltransferase
MHIRTALPKDFPDILRLNEESVRFMSSLSPDRLAQLYAQAAHVRVVDMDDKVIAFLMAFREGSGYDSPNYGWFAARYPRFIYIDRVAVDSSARGKGVGRLLYDDLFAFARHSAVQLITCEFDLEPANPVSKSFHERLGFTEVGTQTYGPSRKLVSLRTLELDASREDIET